MSAWVKACNHNACVEVRRDGDTVMVRDVDENVVYCDRGEWDAFTDGVKRGVFDWDNLTG